jgi:glycerol-3-phosphate acyltransferase PlsX
VSIAKSADPVRAVRSTPEASIVQAARAVAEGRAQALVCAGGTGAALAAGLFNVKRARGIYRPALAIPLPIPSPARAGGHDVILLDVGANAEARRERPRVGLLSNGEEAARGGRLIVETGEELAEKARRGEALRFVGNVEGGDVVNGVADVIVTDGLTGNIALKLMEGVSQTLLGAVRDAAMASTRAKLGGALLRPALREVRDELDPEQQGGAYLLGLRSLGVVPHGRFTRTGFAQAILRARRGAEEDLVGRTQLALEGAGALRERVGAPASASSASLPQAR